MADGRSPGSAARQAMIASASAAGASCQCARMSLGVVSCASAARPLDPRGQGSSQVQISYAVTPNEKTSRRLSACRRRTTSGAM